MPSGPQLLRTVLSNMGELPQVELHSGGILGERGWGGAPEFWRSGAGMVLPHSGGAGLWFWGTPHIRNLGELPQLIQEKRRSE